MALRVFLFGPPRVERDHTPLAITRRKGMALLAYLATGGRPVARETLATLLWPEHDRRSALKNLRRELARVKRVLGWQALTVTRSDLRFNCTAQIEVDVGRFRQQLQHVREHEHVTEVLCPACMETLTAAVDLYGDDFLAGFTLPDSPDFDHWQLFERDSLRLSLGWALEQLANGHAARAAWDLALAHGRRWLHLDPLHEPARRMLMQLHAEAGQLAAALRLYEEGADLLQAELGVAPAKESRQVYEAIRAGRVPESTTVTGAPRRASRLPRQPTPFVGRARELTMIQLRLQERDCRLLTLVGPGGIGKTRLALAVAGLLEEADLALFADGLFFVPLGEALTTEEIVAALIEVMGFPLFGSAGPFEQLLDHLRDKRMLLIMDNLEHLPQSSEIIAAILEATSGIKVLATSRVALRLYDEWFHPLSGLSIPPANYSIAAAIKGTPEAPALDRFDAVRLFVQRARRARPDFDLEMNAAAVVRICRLVEGMPLALELAAAWLRVLDADAVAAELEKDLDLLNARFHDLPPRHRSIRAIFDQTWTMLTPAEQQVMARLSVFRGGFAPEAAIEIAGATLPALSILIDRALLQSAGPGRLRLHELLRQFAAEQLERRELVEETHAAHSHYYLARLAASEAALKSAQQVNTLQAIKVDLENVRHAWQWALDQYDTAAINLALESVFLYFFVRGRNQEGVAFLRPAYQQLAPAPDREGTPILARLASRMALMKSYLQPEAAIEEALATSLVAAEAQQDEAETAFCCFAWGLFHSLVKNELTIAAAAFTRALSLYRALNETYYLIEVLIWTGFAYGNNARLDLYFEFTREALTVARAAGHKTGAAHALGNLVAGAFCVGDYETAEVYAHEVEAIGLELDLPSTIAHAKTQLCLVDLLKGEVERAGKLAAEAHEWALDINHPLSIAYTLSFLGMHANLSGDYARGKRLGEESLAIRAPQFSVVIAHWTVAMACCGLEQDAEARYHLTAMVGLAQEAGFSGMLTWALPLAAIMQARIGDAEESAALLALAQTHPLSPTGWQARWSLLDELRCQLEETLGCETFAAAWARGARLDMEMIVAALLEEKGVGD